MNLRPAYKSTFDRLMLVPMLGYSLLIVVLLVGIFWAITWKAIGTAFSDDELLSAVWLTVVTSVTSTLLSVLVALPSGYCLSKHRIPAKSFLDTLFDMPIVLPPLIMGLSLLIFFSTPIGRWFDRGIWDDGLFVYQPAGIIVVQFLIGAAVATRVTKAGFDSFDTRYEDMAMSLGANRAQTFFKVTLPNIYPSVLAATVISWARIFGLYGPVILVAGSMRKRTEVMSTTVFLEMSIGRIEVAMVVGALMILLSVATLLAFKKFGGRAFL
ncbi:MAG: ABC transporter permease [Planctomycetota bacterium]